jgi:eukaryotic-like serine/threonine-protein kinase
VKLPRTIANYEFVELLGTGSFGSVYRAILRGDLGFHQEVAVKVLNSARARLDKRLIESLANEARILSRAQHPNVVQARHFFAISDDAIGETWALVLELVRGQSLRKLFHWDRHARQPLQIQAPLQMMSELADGLHFAHRLKDEEGNPVDLVHRDLKPENIHVTNEGRIKILDFGIAWAKRRIGEATGGGWTKGTPAYMSPEQLRGDHLDARSDLYSLGAIGYEMLAGERYVPLPDEARDPLGPATRVRFPHREAVLVKALQRRYMLDPGSGAVRELVSLLHDMLAQDKLRRPISGGEVFDRLERLVQLHRPSRGRTQLRQWVEARNQAEERDSQDMPPERQVGPTVLLRPSRDTWDDSIEEEDFSSTLDGEAADDPEVAPTITRLADARPDWESGPIDLPQTVEIPALDGALPRPRLPWVIAGLAVIGLIIAIVVAAT